MSKNRNPGPELPKRPTPGRGPRRDRRRGGHQPATKAAGQGFRGAFARCGRRFRSCAKRSAMPHYILKIATPRA